MTKKKKKKKKKKNTTKPGAVQICQLCHVKETSGYLMKGSQREIFLVQ